MASQSRTADQSSSEPYRAGGAVSAGFPTNKPTGAGPEPIAGNNLQDRIDTALAALEERAAGRGNAIDRASLSPADLFFLADLPLSFETRRFFERRITVADARRIDRILDQAAAPAAMALSSFLSVSAIGAERAHVAQSNRGKAR